MLDANKQPNILEHISKSLNFTIYDCRWIPNTARFIVLGAYPKSTGALQVYELDGDDAKPMNDAETSTTFKSSTFGASSVREPLLATGDFDGRLRLWDLSRLSVPVAETAAHDGIINAIDGYGGKCDGHGPPEITTCGRDGCVRLFDIRQLQTPVASFEPSNAHKRECWCVALGNAFNDTERCLLAGYDNGDIKMFDLKENKVKWETNVKNGVCGVQFDRPDIQMNKFVASCLESEFHVFDARTQHPDKGFAKLTETTEFKSTCWNVQHLPQNREIWMVTHGDGTLALYRYHYPPRRQIKAEDSKLEGVVGSIESLSHMSLSSQPLSCFGWSPDKEGLFVCGALDQQVRVGIVTKLNKI